MQSLDQIICKNWDRAHCASDFTRSDEQRARSQSRLCYHARGSFSIDDVWKLANHYRSSFVRKGIESFRSQITDDGRIPLYPGSGPRAPGHYVAFAVGTIIRCLQECIHPSSTVQSSGCGYAPTANRFGQRPWMGREHEPPPFPRNSQSSAADSAGYLRSVSLQNQ